MTVVNNSLILCGAGKPGYCLCFYVSLEDFDSKHGVYVFNTPMTLIWTNPTGTQNEDSFPRLVKAIIVSLIHRYFVGSGWGTWLP